MKTVTLKQSVTLPAAPDKVYLALMDSTQHADFTGSAAKISPRIGGRFSVYDGWATGTNLELKPGERIVQRWRGADWPEGHFSEAAFALQPAPGGRTKLVFTHSNVPADLARDIADGWRQFYWQPLKAWLKESRD